MIPLTRLNGQTIVLNAFLIETVESTPDTLLTLTTGKKIIVREKVSDVVSLTQKYMQQISAIRVATKYTVTEES
ncbi:flagellar FlbD family protein [Paenibacillus sp. y28]|uniref:flagellar FlbD family protein n=1 Tax=Paenibacillus sp. y28 TaxID=3129110 RepID=UPI003017458C